MTKNISCRECANFMSPRKNFMSPRKSTFRMKGGKPPWLYRSNWCAGFFYLPARLSRIYFTLSSQPGSALRHRYVVDCLEVADSVHVRTCPTKRQLTWTIYATSLLNPNTEPDLSLVCEAKSVTQRRANNRKF